MILIMKLYLYWGGNILCAQAQRPNIFGARMFCLQLIGADFKVNWRHKKVYCTICFYYVDTMYIWFNKIILCLYCANIIFLFCQWYLYITFKFVYGFIWCFYYVPIIFKSTYIIIKVFLYLVYIIFIYLLCQICYIYLNFFDILFISYSNLFHVTSF